MTSTRHLIGLLLGTEEDWPTAFEEILSQLGPVDGHTFDCERITIEPFRLRDRPRYHLVIDRLAYWYYVPREWLKKVALMDGVYLLNSPFTFQSMEKHAAYCAMMRLGLKVPETVLVPFKNPVDNARYAYTAARYNRPFDLDAIAAQIGYPLFMKPYDGGAWRGVSRINNPAELHTAYDASGEMLMHLQKAIDYDVFARSLSIGAETMVMKFQPDQPMHLRYAVDHSFLSPQVGAEVVTIGRLVNAFFRWEFNSCETLVRGSEVYPIDYANACPDVALTSLHYYFPWAMKALVKWCVFALVTGRRPRLDLETDRFFAIADEPGMSYGGEAGRLPRAGRRLLRDRALPGLLREQALPPGPDRAGLGGRCRLRPAAGPDGPVGVPGPRAREVHRAPARSARPVGARRERAAGRGLRGYEYGKEGRFSQLSGGLKWAVTSRRSRSAARIGVSTGTRCGARSTCSPACSASACSRRTPRRWARKSS